MRKVLIANRGEIAVRVIRACKDAGYASVAVYADPDRDALHVRMADEAFALGGTTPGDSYLVIDKVIAAARQSGADAVHPGYGFLSENADFAQAVLDAGLTWIGPSPQAIRDLGDKVTARHIATRAGAPLVPGTPDPVAGADEVVAFATGARPARRDQGGVRRRRPRPEDRPHHRGDPRAVRQRRARGGQRVRPRRVLRRALPRPVPARRGAGARRPARQRDRRRHPRLLAAAAQPEAGRGGAGAVPDRRAARHASTPRPRRSAARRSYSGAGTVEYLVGSDGIISFLEVNTRLQVEHPVTEETSGIDLVREQFRIAEGETLRFTEDPTPRGHAFEFRINGEDPGRGFLPAPGTVTDLPRAGRPRRAGRLRHRGALGDRRRVRLAAGQADRLRREPRPRRSSGPAARWTSTWSRAWPRRCRSTGRWCAIPAFAPADGPAVHRLHPLDRDRVRQRDPAVRPAAGDEPAEAGPARDDRGRGRRQAARGVAAGRLRRGRRGRRRTQGGAEALGGARSPQRRPPVTR